MPKMPDPGHAGQGTDQPALAALPDPPERRTRATALRLTREELAHVRVAVRKVARAVGGFPRLSILLGVPTSTVYYAARPHGRCSPGFAIRLAAVAKVPVEVLLGGKVVVAHVVGVAA